MEYHWSVREPSWLGACVFLRGLRLGAGPGLEEQNGLGWWWEGYEEGPVRQNVVEARSGRWGKIEGAGWVGSH